MRENSLWHNVDEPKKYFRKYIRALITGFEYLENFLSGRKFFRENSEVKNIALETYVRAISIYFDRIYLNFPEHEFSEILYQEFSERPNAALLSIVFSLMNFYRLKLSKTLRRTTELEKIERQDKKYISELENFIQGTLNK